MQLKSAFFAVLVGGAAAVKPEVNLGYSRYVGTPLDNDITQWLGVRYAAPPVGDLRFQAPQEPLRVTEVQSADKHGGYCPGTGQALTKDMSEDCLYVDVYAPTHATRCSKLPVFVYIGGGGFGRLGAPNMNGTDLVSAADLGMIFVAFNYRVGPLGFMTTGDVSRDDIDSNIGLLDQQMVLKWIKKHIRRFGGDPDHVILGGASAGAASISLHLAAYDGQDQGLFVGAAAESVSFGPVLTAEQSRYQYVELATSLGCWSDDDTDVLACMRSRTIQEIQAKNTVYPYPGGQSSKGPAYMWSPFIDGDFIRDLTVTRFEEGRYIRVPMLIGDDTNGGTSFAPRDATTLEDSNQFMLNQFPALTNKHLAKLEKLYPNPNDTCPNIGCYWRQASNVYGEMRYMCPSIYLSNVFSERRHSPKTWTYRWDVEDPERSAQGYGVQHVVEAYSLFGPDSFFSGGSPASYLPGGINAITIPIMQGYWTSFIKTLDPNNYRYPGTAKWEAWGRKEREKQRLRFGTGGTTDMETIDKDLKKRCKYLDSIALDLTQ